MNLKINHVKQRRESISKAALLAAKERGLYGFTLKDVAERAKCVPSTVRYYFNSINHLRLLIISYGKENKIEWITSQIVPDGLSASYKNS